MGWYIRLTRCRFPQNCQHTPSPKSSLTTHVSLISTSLCSAGMTDLLQSGDFTLFAPVNTAFSMDQGSAIRLGTPNAIGIYQAVLKYHIVPGGRRASQLKNNMPLFTLHGPKLNVTVNNGVTVNTVAHVVDADILATNGIIHAVDHQLIPPDIDQIMGGNGR